jgi:hypothetical protein
MEQKTSRSANKDNVPNDLKSMFESSRNHNFDIDEAALMMKLVSYIVRRDFKVFDHAYKVGVNDEKMRKKLNTMKGLSEKTNNNA